MNMKKIILSITVLTFLLIMKPGLFPHMEIPGNYEQILLSAKAVAVAKITDIESTESRCSSSRVYTFKITETLKGRIDENREYKLYYSIFYWKQATWPWQEDCPSVHYTVPPVAQNMEKGKSYIITIQRDDDRSDYYISSSKDMSEMQTIMNKIRRGR